MADKSSQVKARFEAEGLSISEWARANGFSVVMVYRVLSGESKGIRGEAHKIAVALGLKNEPKKLHFRVAVEAA
jgi:gp16 family phage-associated protein